ncbi:MAG: substrate-binding domain-containing protein, partial [Chloroflexota bacterium]
MFHAKNYILVFASTLMVLALILTGCATPTTPDTTERPALSGTVEIDGSSTVYPITEAVAEEFHKLYPQMHINVGISGTGGGFKRFVVGETHISDASRPIT